MNERILELAEQAGIAVWGDAVYMYHPSETLDSTVMTKFALLIVRECIQAIQNESMNSSDEFEHGLRFAEGAILDHFGVKE
jgi:hypothetical protein